MAASTQTTPNSPVNVAVALAALKAADTAVGSSRDATAKLIALRKELETLRAERDAARFRVEDLEEQTSRLHRDLQRSSAATSVLRNCPRRLPRTMSFVLAFAVAGVAAWINPAAAKAPATDAVYVCEVEGKLPIYLNLTKHRFRFADQSGVLNEGLFFNFTTSRGYTMTFDLGDPDRLHFKRPPYVNGTATVSGNGSVSEKERVDCALSGAARAKKSVPARSASEVETLKDKWFDANGQCRGGSGAASDRGCALRERLSKQLEARGQCFAVEKTETMTNSVWKRCP